MRFLEPFLAEKEGVCLLDLLLDSLTFLQQKYI